MAVDISELFTHAVRELMDVASGRQIGVSFDYRGPRAHTSQPPADLLRGMRRVLGCAFDLLESGQVAFEAECLRDAAGPCRLRIDARVTGRLVERDEQLRRLHGLVADGVRSPVAAQALHGSGRCPASDATVSYVSQLGDGAQITLQIDTLDAMPDEPAPRAALAHSSNAVAWLIHGPGGIAAGLPRRLARLGWTTIQFRTPQQACARLQARPSSVLMPSLLVATESALHSDEQLAALRRLLAPWTHCVIAGTATPALGGRRRPVAGYEARRHPLSPAELDELTSRFAGSDSSPSYHQFGMPLHLIDRPRMLIAETDPVDRIVATGMAQCLGHDVETARDGRMAIDKCLALPPAVILMGLDLPRLNGLDAARRIRALQRRGVLPPCSIVATTASDDPGVRRACLDAGMDGVLRKPLFMLPLQEELRRLCADGARVR